MFEVIMDTYGKKLKEASKKISNKKLLKDLQNEGLDDVMRGQQRTSSRITQPKNPKVNSNKMGIFVNEVTDLNPKPNWKKGVSTTFDERIPVSRQNTLPIRVPETPQGVPVGEPRQLLGTRRPVSNLQGKDVVVYQPPQKRIVVDHEMVGKPQTLVKNTKYNNNLPAINEAPPIISRAAGDRLLRGANVGAGAVGLAMMGKDLYNRYQTGTLGMGDPSDPLSPANTDFVDTLIDKRKRNELPYYYKDLSQEQVTVPDPNFGDNIMSSMINQSTNPNIPTPYSNEWMVQAAAATTSDPTNRQNTNDIINNTGDKPSGLSKVISKTLETNTQQQNEELFRRVQQKKAEGKPLGQVDSFLDALTYFLPTALGGALGLAFGGVEAGVAGATNAQNLYNGYLDQKDKQFDRAVTAEELELKKLELAGKADKRNFQQTGLTTKSGERVMFDTELGYVNSQGNPVDAADLIDQQLEYQKSTEERRLRQEQQKYDLDAQLTEPQLVTIRDINTAELSLKDINIDQLISGPVEGRTKEWLQQIGIRQPADEVKLKSQLEQALLNYQLAITGKAATDNERKTLKEVTATLKDDPKNFSVKLRQFIRNLHIRREAFVESIAIGQPKKAETVRQFLKNPIVSKDVLDAYEWLDNPKNKKNPDYSAVKKAVYGKWSN